MQKVTTAEFNNFLASNKFTALVFVRNKHKKSETTKRSLASIEERLGGVIKVGFADIDDERKLAQLYGATDPPVTIFFAGGKQVNMLQGAYNQEKLESAFGV